MDEKLYCPVCGATIGEEAYCDLCNKQWEPENCHHDDPADTYGEDYLQY